MFLVLSNMLLYAYIVSTKYGEKKESVQSIVQKVVYIKYIRNSSISIWVRTFGCIDTSILAYIVTNDLIRLFSTCLYPYSILGP